MATSNLDFKIRQGLSEQLLEADGVTPKQNVRLELGCWYLCIDTACVYICVKKDQNGADDNSNKTLKKLNATTFEATFEDIDNRITELENEARYVKINSETELPRDFQDPAFNPKTSYYVVTDKDAGFISLYIFDEGLQGYVCTNKADMSALEAKVEAVVDSKFNELVAENLDETIDTKLAIKVPSAVKTAIETQVLFGGNSTTTTDDDVLR